MKLSLTNSHEESFSSSIDDILYNFNQRWNTKGQFWVLDISDSDGNSLAFGVKIVAQLDLLALYPHIPFELRSENEFDPGRNDLLEFVLEVSTKNV
jgi:hypothetical protein